MTFSEGFVWKDKDNRIMWKDGAVVKDAFAERCGSS